MAHDPGDEHKPSSSKTKTTKLRFKVPKTGNYMLVIPGREDIPLELKEGNVVELADSSYDSSSRKKPKLHEVK